MSSKGNEIAQLKTRHLSDHEFEICKQSTKLSELGVKRHVDVYSKIIIQKILLVIIGDTKRKLIVNYFWT